MKKYFVIASSCTLLFFLPICNLFGQTKTIVNIPSLDALAGKWIPEWQEEQSPAICNFYGSLQAGYNIASIAMLSFPPFSQGPYNRNNLRDPDRFFKDILQLNINNKPVITSYSKWYPYQIKRKTTIGALEVETIVRMVFENNGVLWKIRFKNINRQKSIHAKISLVLRNSHIRQYDSIRWCWRTPRPIDNNFVTEVHNPFVIDKDKKSKAVTCYYFKNHPNDIIHSDSSVRVNYLVSLPPGADRQIEVVMAVDSSGKEVLHKSDHWQQTFDQVFEKAKSLWAHRYQQAFMPDNTFFSGCLPILKTKDSALKRVYYSSITSLLELLRTHFTTGYQRVFVTLAPDYGIL